MGRGQLGAACATTVDCSASLECVDGTCRADDRDEREGGGDGSTTSEPSADAGVNSDSGADGPSDSPSDASPAPDATVFGTPTTACSFLKSGAGRQYVTSVAVAADGRIGLGGAFNRAFDLGDGSISLPPGSETGAFVAVLDPSCKLIFGRGLGANHGAQVTFDSAGNLWAAAGKGPPAATHLIAMSATGSVLHQADFASAYPYDIVGAPNGDIVIGGEYTGSAFTIGGPVLPATTHTNIFVARLSPSGAHLWSKGFGGTVECQRQLRQLALDPATGDIVFAGLFGGVPTGCTFSAGGAQLASSPSPKDYFASLVVRLSSNGDHIWSRRWPTSVAAGIAVLPSGRVWASGWITDVVDLGSGPMTLRDGGGRDGFIMQLLADGGTVAAAPIRVDGGAKSGEVLGKQIVAGPSIGERGLVLGHALVPTTTGQATDFAMVSEPDGTSGWTTYKSTAIMDIASGPDGEIVMGGMSGSSTSEDIWLTKFKR